MSFHVERLSPSQRKIVAENTGLRLYLRNLERAKEPTPRSWLFEGEDGHAVLDRWMKVLNKLSTGTWIDKLVFQFDLKQREKFGPQGGHPPVAEGMTVDSFSSQYEPTSGSPRLPSLVDVLHLRPGSLNYRSFDAVIDNMRDRDTLTTNSGWNLFTRREKVKDVSVKQAESGIAKDFPAILLFRQYNGKLRIVWMYPMSMNLLEYQATQPLQDIIRASTAYVTPWAGFEDVKRRFTYLWGVHPFAFGGDTTAMDAHMQKPQLLAVADSFRTLFKDSSQAEETLLHVADIDIVVGEDSIIRNQAHGIASGSGWTQLSETIFQIGAFSKYIAEHKLPLTVDDGMGIGDDYVWFFDNPPDSEEIVKFWEEMGLPGKPEKQSNDPTHCTFLQRLFVKGFFSRDDSAVLGGIYPTIRALNSMLYPERWFNSRDWSSDAFCIRIFQILENTVDHPLFEEFVRFVVAGHKDLLPFAKTKASRLDRIQREVRKKLPSLSPSYNQEKRDKALSAYSSIKYAATL